MNVDSTVVRAVETLAASLLLGLMFLRAQKARVLRALDDRTAASMAAGAAVAYVFIHLLPELGAARYAASKDVPFSKLLRFEALVALATMVGFLGFYALSVLSRDTQDETIKRPAGLPLQGIVWGARLAAFAGYAWVVNYLLVDPLEGSTVRVLLYTGAMGLHFLSLGRELHHEQHELYQRVGGPLLAASCVAGWGCAMIIDLHKPLVTLLLSVVAGGILANTMVSELPREDEGRLLPFLLGASLYAVLLLIAR